MFNSDVVFVAENTKPTKNTNFLGSSQNFKPELGPFLSQNVEPNSRLDPSLSIIWNSSSHLPAKTTVTAGTNRPREVFIFRTVIVFKYFFVIIISVIQPPKKQTKDWAMNGSAEISPFDFMSNLEFENV